MEEWFRLMTQKSLVYMVLAVAVGYFLVSAVPQQVAIYTSPQYMQTTSDDAFGIQELPKLGDGEVVPESGDVPSDLATTENLRGGGFEEPSFLETSRLTELMKWWTLDIVVALSIYWVARKRLN
jgi:hypothetical protein